MVRRIYENEWRFRGRRGRRARPVWHGNPCKRLSIRNWFTVVRMLLHVSHGISNVTFSPTPKIIIVEAIFSPENVYVTENPLHPLPNFVPSLYTFASVDDDNSPSSRPSNNLLVRVTARPTRIKMCNTRRLQVARAGDDGVGGKKGSQRGISRKGTSPRCFFILLSSCHHKTGI